MTPLDGSDATALRWASAISLVAAEFDRGVLITPDRLRAAMRWHMVPPHMRLRFVAQLGLCSLCGLPLPLSFTPQGPQSPTLDHCVPRADGGGGGCNCLVAHHWCNSTRGRRPLTADQQARATATRLRLAGWITSRRTPGSDGTVVLAASSSAQHVALRAARMQCAVDEILRGAATEASHG